jgi:hypothetical protein
MPEIPHIEAVARREQEQPSVEHRQQGPIGEAPGGVAVRPAAVRSVFGVTPQQPAPDVYIHIGRIEIRPVEAPAASPQKRTAPLPQPVSLADYLRAGG